MTDTISIADFEEAERLAWSEKEFQARVIAEAKAQNWLVFFTQNSRRSPEGEPDLRLIRERVIWAELKTEKGKLTKKQLEALERLNRACEETYVWRPSDVDQITQKLAPVLHWDNLDWMVYMGRPKPTEQSGRPAWIAEIPGGA